MKTAKEVLTKYSDGDYTQFQGYENILMAMEEYAKEYHESRRMQVINECKDELLKHMFLMKHINGYPSKAVPQATILELPALMNLATRKQLTPPKD